MKTLFAKNFAIISGIICILYYISVFALSSIWGRVYTGISVRLDLMPEQIPLVPLGFNLIAALLGLPTIVSHFNKSDKNNKKPIRVAFNFSCISIVILLFVGSVRWVISDTGNVLTGVKEGIVPLNNASEEFESISDGVYRNTDVGLTCKIPDNWQILTSNAIRRAHATGVRSMVEASSTNISSKLPEGIDQFFVIKKYPETHEEYNPTLAFVSYEKKVMLGMGMANFDSLVASLAVILPPNKLLFGPGPSKVGTFDGIEIRLKGEYPGWTIRQYIYAFETNTHYFTVTAGFQNPDDLNVLKTAIDSIAAIHEK